MKSINITLFILIMLFNAGRTTGQISFINPLNETYSMLSMEQLYSFSIYNQLDRDQNLDIILTITNDKNIKVFSSESSNRSIPALSMIMVQEFPFQIVEFENTTANYYYNNQTFPPGKYRVCVNLYSASESRGTVLYSECSNTTINTILKLHLVSPEDGAKLDDPKPIFNWTPLEADEIQYTINIYDAQSNVKAKSILVPFNKITNLSDNFYSYEDEFKELQVDNLYEWEVIANYNNTTIDKSEKWKFTIKDKSTKPGDYRLLQKRMNPSDYIQNNVIRFAYDNRYNESKLNYKLTNIKRNEEVTNIPEIALSNTINKIEINLFSISGLSYNETYLLTISNKFNEEFVLTFKIKSPDEE